MTNVYTDQGTACSLFECLMIMSYTFFLRMWGPPGARGPGARAPMAPLLIRHCVPSMPNTYWDLWHQPIWTYTSLCTNSTRITYNTINCQVLSVYAHIVYINVWTYFMYIMCCWVVRSSLFTLKLKLLMKSALSLIFCMCIHTSKICLMHSTCKLIMSLIFNIK